MSSYRIAGLLVEMDTFGRTARQAAPYQTADAAPDMTVRAEPEVLAQAAQMGRDYAEYLATGASFYRQLVRFGGMMLHASCVVVDGRAYLFSAPCGTGKSTHVSLWLREFGDRAYILNDDKPALRFLPDGTLRVFGTPWCGKHGLSRNADAPLGGIAFLERAEENAIRPMSGKEAVYALMDQTVRKLPGNQILQCMELIDRIVAGGKLWKLSCNMKPAAARLSYQTMSGKGVLK